MAKYAICFRGISYAQTYANELEIPSYTVDFSDCIPFYKKNLIDPLIEKGHEVDIFFNTYTSKKLSEYIVDLNPVSVRLKTLDLSIKRYNWPHIIQLIIDALLHAKDFQDGSGQKYDYVILTRFDLVIFQDFSEIFIPENAISVPTKNDDCFIVVSGNLIDTAIAIYQQYQHQHELGPISHHMVYRFLEHGIRYHAMYSTPPADKSGGNHYPVWRLGREIFTPPGHRVKLFDVEDIFNKDSKYYGFLYKPHTEFISCADVK